MILDFLDGGGLLSVNDRQAGDVSEYSILCKGDHKCMQCVQILKASESIHFLELSSFISCDGRVVKALDLKSNGVSPRRFESCSQRKIFNFLF